MADTEIPRLFTLSCVIWASNEAYMKLQKLRMRRRMEWFACILPSVPPGIQYRLPSTPSDAKTSAAGDSKDEGSRSLASMHDHPLDRTLSLLVFPAQHCPWLEGEIGPGPHAPSTSMTPDVFFSSSVATILLTERSLVKCFPAATPRRPKWLAADRQSRIPAVRRDYCFCC